MARVRSVLTRSALVVILAALSPALMGQNLSGYREFQLGADLATIAKQTGARASQAKVIHSRPALIQTLSWRPQPLGLSLKAESSQEVVFSFYDGALFGIVVNYDRYETEGLTPADMVEALSAAYGTAGKSSTPAKAAADSFSDQEELLERWEDRQHRVEWVRFPYGSSYRLTAVLKSLEAPIQAAILDAKRLDNEEAPQRDAARLANKANFRP